jgi:hypothetical protein
MKTHRPTIDSILDEFFTRCLDGTKGVRRTRISETSLRLRRCIESVGDRYLISSDLALVQAERQFNPHSALARTMHADDLAFVLVDFVRDPWLFDDRLEQRVQLQLTEWLAASLIDRGLIDSDDLCCVLIELRIGIDSARRELDRERRERRQRIAREAMAERQRVEEMLRAQRAARVTPDPQS